MYFGFDKYAGYKQLIKVVHLGTTIFVLFVARTLFLPVSTSVSVGKWPHYKQSQYLFALILLVSTYFT
ncbi:hypothetical protein CW304_18855 [Bacillus sp. UFRGS-B20]|nr:hypothetical protein CW304_18855 [Bacillus sp. UFRGS-B20]